MGGSPTLDDQFARVRMQRLIGAVMANRGDPAGLENLRPAIFSLEQVSRTAPSSPLVLQELATDYRFLGVLLDGLGDYQAAAESYQKALSTNLAGENDSAGAVPVPDKDAVCGLPPRVSLAIESIAERLPDAVGVNVTLILQMVLGARAVPHVVLCAKSPLIEIELMLSVALPAFVSVMVWAALVVPTN
jgi:hypothetical protein